MRLLQIRDAGDFSLVNFEGGPVPPYAILSHTWGADNEEVTFSDLGNGAENKTGYRKVVFCREQAANDGLGFFWIDTCCIDRSSSSELSEAIISMFRWYQGAAKCYVYLSDVSISNFAMDSSSIQESKWFQRGWTLQELLAPTSVEFFSREQSRLGDKDSLMPHIAKVTGIPFDALQGSPLSQFSIKTRVSWLGKRQTKREEDRAYCLLGVLDVQMVPLYGEGERMAFKRLLGELSKFIQVQPSALTQRTIFAKPTKRNYDLSSTMPSSKCLDSVERSNIADLHSVHARTSKYEEINKHYRVALRPAAYNLKDNRLRARERKLYTHDAIDASELTISQLHNDPKFHDEALINTPTFIEKHIANKNEGSPPNSMTGGLIGESMHVNSGDFATDLVLQLTKLEEGIQSDRVQYTSIQETHTLLLSIEIVNNWLDVKNFNDRHNVAQFYDKQISSHLKGTCEWIFTHSAYTAWVSVALQDARSKILWASAPAGFGKTVLCTQVIEHLKRSELLPVAYFFASPHAQAGGEPSFIIRSWIAQMTQLDSNILELVQSQVVAGQRAPESIVWSLFSCIVSGIRGCVFAVDGFDEYSQADNARARFLRELKKSTDGTASRILIMSRNETDIESELSTNTDKEAGHVIIQCRITKEDVRNDISLFSRSVVDEKLPKKDNRLRQDLAEQLTEKCEGMFLWIKLQQDQLQSGKNAKRLRNIVENMPVGLYRTYERNWKVIQNHIPENLKRALAILEWTIYAFRPLSVAELTEALAIEYDNDGAIVQWDDLPDDIDEEYIKDDIINICGGLVETRAKNPEDGARLWTVHLIHPSVQEFLLPTLSPSSLDATKSYLVRTQSICQIEQHEHLATICLTFLDNEDAWQRYTAQSGSVYQCGFINYAADNWGLHTAVVGGKNTNLNRLIKDFFGPGNKNFDLWERHNNVCDAKSTEGSDKERLAATPLYHAALLDLLEVMEHVFKQDEAQLNKVGGEYGTPLQAVCFKGYEAAFDKLLEWGADPNVEGGKFGVPINAAIAEKHGGLVEKLLDIKDVDLSLKDPAGRTPLYTAAWSGDVETLLNLFKAGAEKDTKDNNNLTPLHVAAGSNHLEVVRLLLKKGADTAAANNNGWTPLYVAAYSGYLEVVELLLEEGADTTAADSDGWTPLHVAVNGGHLEVIRLLVQNRADVAAANSSGFTSLHLAAFRGHLEVVELLVQNRADVATANSSSITPLYVATYNGHLEVVKLLVEDGTDVEAANNNFQTLFHVAARSGHVEVIGLLLKKGADVKATESDGWTPLNSAADGGHLEVVRLLLENGADVEAANNGWTSLNLAADNGHLEVVRLLLENGADVTAASNNGWTPLDSAAKSGHLEVVGLLLENRADPEAANNGWASLDLAADNGHLEVVRLLLKNGADVAAADNHGWTPLDSAVGSGHLEVVRLLLENGADVEAAKNGWAPLNSAAENGDLEIVRLLVEKGTYLAVNGIDLNYGTAMNYLAFEGYTEILQLAYEHRHANLYLAEAHGQTPLLLAARGGHIDTLQYLIGLGLDPMVEDVKGDGLLCYAASGGTSEVLRAVLELNPKFSCTSSQWSPLHWACRAGVSEVVELLTTQELCGESVTVPQFEGQWSPLAIALFHGEEEMLEDLSTSCRSQLGTEANTIQLRGERHDSYSCKGCLHDVFGPRFHCRTCKDVDYCFMCKPFVASLHENHEWESFLTHYKPLDAELGLFGISTL